MKKLTLVALILSSLMWIHCTPSGPETTNKQGNIPSSTGGGGSNPPPVGDTVQPPPSTGGGDTTQPPPSGDGETTTSQTITKILFETSSNDATRTLSTMDLDGTHISPLAIPGHSYITASEPSPDGNYIAFVSTKENGGQIWIWNRKTSQTTRLTDIAPTDYFICSVSSATNHVLDHCLSWSADSTEIVFSVGWGLNHNRQIYKANINQPLIPQKLSLVKTPDNIEPFFSPKLNTKRIAYVGLNNVGSKSFLFSFNEQNQEQQFTSNANEYIRNPNWSPDGNKLAYVSQRFDLSNPKDHKVVWMNLEPDAVGVTGIITQIGSSRTQVYDKHPLWSPDSTKILFLSYDEASERNQIYYYDIMSKRLIFVINSGTEFIGDNSTTKVYGDLCWLNNDAIVYASAVSSYAVIDGEDNYSQSHAQLFSTTINSPHPKQLTTIGENTHPTLWRYTSP